jgi:hypothetical protein
MGVRRRELALHAWAAWRVFQMDRKQRRETNPGDPGDLQFLERVCHKVLLNFTWWVNRKDAQGRNIFQSGFLGFDNLVDAGYAGWLGRQHRRS